MQHFNGQKKLMKWGAAIQTGQIRAALTGEDPAILVTPIHTADRTPASQFVNLNDELF